MLLEAEIIDSVFYVYYLRYIYIYIHMDIYIYIDLVVAKFVQKEIKKYPNTSESNGV